MFGFQNSDKLESTGKRALNAPPMSDESRMEVDISLSRLYDVETSSIEWPPVYLLPNTTGDPTATFKNNGDTQATFDAHFEIDSSGTNIYTGNVQSITLDPGAETTWVFIPSWTSAPTQGIIYRVIAYIVMPGDENPSNDTFSFFTQPIPPHWIQCAYMPTAEMCHATCYDSTNDHIYSFGGYQGGASYQPFTYQYDPVVNSWSTMASMPSAICWIDASVTDWNRSIYIFGGYDGSFHDYNYIYDIAGDSWSTGAYMPSPRMAGGQVAYNDSLVYYLCGHDGGGGTNTVHIYNTYTDSWTTGTNAPTTSYMQAQAITGDTIWLIMSYDGSNCNPNMYMGIIDPAHCETISWSTSAALPCPVFNGGGTQIYRDNASLVIVGGLENASTPTAHAWEYDIANDTWIARPDYPMTICRNDFLTYRRTGSAAEIFVAGGDNSGNWTVTSEVWRHEFMVAEEEMPEKDALVFGLSRPAPNPVSNSATITYTTTQRGFVSLKIYDASGRLVRTLVNGTEHAGRKTIRWDGKGNDGQDVAAGIYFCQLTLQSKTVCEKLVVVR